MATVEPPVAPNRMKMSEGDFGEDRNTASGMKMSDRLSLVPGTASEEAPAARNAARPAAGSAAPAPPLGRGLDQTLGRLKHGASAAAAARPGNEDETDKPLSATKAAEQSRLSFNKWLIGLAALLLASVGVLPMLLRTKRSDGQRAPWWSVARGDGAREAELLQATRMSAASRKKQQAPVDRDADENFGMAEDKALERYVQHFVKRVEEPVRPAQRMEPLFRAETDDLEQSATATTAAVSQPTLELVSDTDLESTRLPTRSTVETFALVSDVMQEAEFWKMLNETQRAIDILESYCNTPAPDSPLPWMYLADIYAACGELARHAQLAERFSTRFNGRLTLQDDAVADASRTLEDFPHLMRQITEIWNQPYVLPFLQDLLFNRRDTPRYGFDLSAYKDILLLIDVAREREALAA